jgi:hypothetical protein
MVNADIVALSFIGQILELSMLIPHTSTPDMLTNSTLVIVLCFYILDAPLV